MKRKVYFAGSIRGGRNDASLYHEMIECIKETDIVLTEQVGNMTRSIQEQDYDAEKVIYDQDTEWLRSADLLIAECTSPSLGVGYELAYAERFNIPCYVLYRKKDTKLSAMIKGNSYYHIIPYETKEEALAEIRRILDTFKSSKQLFL